ncbi:hypothetical protein ABU614_04835 [Lysobacter firmicutimachus]|uniref:Uncharacterized protein n=1 Tax=Lysobacter firmicutimachus TaxID=1792846 RepID=A0AAU8MV31_9GAMM|nr:hypothetical protein [Lysobacter antibioticus]
MKNIEVFSIATARICAAALEQHPVVARFNAEESARHLPGLDPNNREAMAAAVLACGATFEWLLDEGYLRSGACVKESLNGVAFVHVALRYRLTEKGLAVLGTHANTAEESKTIGERLVAAVKLGGAERIKESVKLMIGAGAGTSTRPALPAYG